MKTKRVLQIAASLTASIAAVMTINFGQAFAVANNCTWTGAVNNNFNTAGNWSTCGGTVPQAGDNLVFDDTSLSAAGTPNNDIVGLSVGNVKFMGTNATWNYQVGGNALTLTGGITDQTTATQPAGFNVDTTLSGNQTLSTTHTYGTYFFNLKGAGNLAVSGGGMAELRDMTNYTGTVSSADSMIEVMGGITEPFTSSGGITVSGAATLSLFNNGGGKSATTLHYNLPISLGGTGLPNKNEALMLDGGQTDAVTNVLGGSVTLTSDVGVLATGSNTLNITGQINYNGHSISSVGANVTTITVAQGTDLSSTNPTVGKNVTYIDDGKVGATTIADGGLLEGSGSTAALNVLSGGVYAPGHSPGCMSTGNLTLSGIYQVQIGGTTACSGYDQTKVTGTVNVSGATLNISAYNGFSPSVGQSYLIIDNDGSDAVTGTFSGIAEGGTITAGGIVYKVSYKGGDGNDVVLTVSSKTTAPDTGLNLIRNNPLTTFLVSTLAGILLIAQSRRATKRR